MATRSCPPQLTWSNLLPRLRLLPANRPTKAFPASECPPAKTHLRPSALSALPFFFLSFLSSGIGRGPSQTPRTPVVTWEKRCPCLGHRLIASKVKSFVLGKGKHELGIAVVRRWMKRYHCSSVSRDVRKQLKALHRHRCATAFPMVVGPPLKHRCSLLLGSTSPTGSPSCTSSSLCCPAARMVLLLSGLHNIQHLNW